MLKTLFTLLVVVVSLIALAQNPDQGTPAPAKQLIEQAQQRAAAEGKSVLVKFHASWCGWCHKMDAVLKQDDLRVLLDRYFVVVSLDTLENQDKKSLENPGAMQFLIAAGGENQGIPFFYIADSKGKILITSMTPPDANKKSSNIGCPYEEKEIAHFLAMLKKGAPRISQQELNQFKSAFAELKKKDGK